MTRKPSAGSKQEPVVVRKDGAQIYVGYDKECGASRLCPHAQRLPACALNFHCHIPC